MTIANSRVTQYIAILLILGTLGAGYFYFSVRAGVKQGAPLGGPAPSNLVGYWSFDGDDISGTTAYDRSGSGNNGTLTNGPTQTNGKLGQAMNFDGTNDLVSLANSASMRFTGNGTLSSWVYLSSSWSTSGTIMIKNTDQSGFGWGMRLNIDATKKPNIAVTHTDGGDHTHTLTSTKILPTSTWVYITGVWDGTNLNIYIDGVLTDTLNIGSGTLRVNTAGPGGGIGASNATSNASPASPFNGSIDEVRIYNAALTASQIYDLYKLGGETVGASTPTRDSLNEGLAGYWKLDDASGTTAVDSSTNANNGTLTNGPTWTTGKIDQGLSFSGTANVSTTNTLDTAFTGPITLSVWANDTPGNGNLSFISKVVTSGATNNPFDFGSDNSATPKLYFTRAGTDVRGWNGPNTVPGSWHHYVVTSNTSDITIAPTFYVDGVASTGTYVGGSGTGNATGSGAVIKIGRRPDGVLQMVGSLDEVRVYSRALSAEEVTKLYKTTVPTNPDTRLKGYWSFDGDSLSGTTARDLSGSGNNGTLTSGPTKTLGIRGQAMNFDGANDYVDITDSTGAMNASGDYSSSMWINLDSSQTTYAAIYTKTTNGSANAYGLQLCDGTGTFKVSHDNNCGMTFDSKIALSAVQFSWHHVAITRSGTTMRAYLDGVQMNMTSGTSAPATGNGALYIGAERQRSNFIKGKLDEVRIYNAALTASEIYNLYQEGSVKVNKAQSNNGDSLNDGLAGYWKLDDASGVTATDSSTNANNGTLTNGPTWGTGQIGGAVTFDGTDDYIIKGSNSSLQLTTQGTLSAWIYSNIDTSTNDARGIISKRSGDATSSQMDYSLMYANDSGQNRIIVNISNGSSNSSLVNTTSLTKNTWYHTVVTWNSGTAVIYINGVGQTFTSVNNSQASADPVYIGKRATNHTGGFQGFFNGKLDEARVYNRALSAEEVTKLYKTTSPTNPETGLVGYWSFNGKDLSGTTAYDRSGRGNNGTLTNGPTKTIGKIGQALSFDGTDDHTSVPDANNIDITSTITISAWVRGNNWANTENNFIVAKNDRIGGLEYRNYQLGVDTSGQFNFGFTQLGVGGAATSPNTLNVRQWYFVTATYDQTNIKLYENGVLVNTTAETDAMVANANILSIGRAVRNNNTSYGEWDGSIDEVRVYNRALSSTEISSLYNFGR